MGYSTKETDWLGGEYIQHHDDNGNKAGYSRTETGFFGGEYTQHYSQSGDKEGYSQKEAGLLGGEYVQHYTQAGEKAGYSEDDTSLLGDYRQNHHGQDGGKQGHSTFETGLFGGSYKRHQGVEKGRPTSDAAAGGAAAGGSGPVEGGAGIVVLLLLIGLGAILAKSSFVSRPDSAITPPNIAPALQQFSNSNALRQSSPPTVQLDPPPGVAGLAPRRSGHAFRVSPLPSGPTKQSPDTIPPVAIETRESCASDKSESENPFDGGAAVESNSTHEAVHGHSSDDRRDSSEVRSPPAAPSPESSPESDFVIPPNRNRYMSNALYRRYWEENLARRQSR